MRSDTSVTVTRDIPVTSRVPSARDIALRSRVSHATTTTPHHTMLVLAASCGVSINAGIRRQDRSGALAASMHALREIGGGL